MIRCAPPFPRNSSRDGVVIHAIGDDAKGNKQRSVRFGERTRQALEHYIRSFRGDAPGYLLLTARGRRHLNRSAMRTIFQRLGQECGIPKVHPHRFRHTFATWAIEQQAREIDVQRLLGHSTSAMLRRYTASYDAEKAAQAHASFSPSDRLGAAPVSVT